MVFVYSVSPVYSKNVSERLHSRIRRKPLENADATGVAVALECGTNIKFYLPIEEQTGAICDLTFRSNGCGFMLAAADTIAEILNGNNLGNLHGLRPEELTSEIKNAIGSWPSYREHCIVAVLDAIRNAFAEYRRARIEEFAGERALICTCFGVSEERIENTIRNHSARTVEDIGRLTNAGTGCGSCQMLIREMIDAAESSN